jgi:hypothetical protein
MLARVAVRFLLLLSRSFLFKLVVLLTVAKNTFALYTLKCISNSCRKIQQNATVYQKFIIPYLHEAQHVWGVTPPIIRSLKLH